MPAAGERARGLSITDRAILRDGMPWVPVSGEIHYSRVPRARWAERLRQMRAGGITVASAYVIWLHHEPVRGQARFDGRLDVGAFVDECERAGLDVVLRIGPWAHGEVRNGGFPDWVQAADVRHRSDDPGYLALVREWFAQLADALDGRAQPGGPVIAVQLENELYDRPAHLATLKRLAREAGIAAPLWTATAWGGAQLPERPGDEVLPLFSGYADGFWVDPGEPWHPTFRAHFFPSHEWDDPGVGADVRAAQGFADTTASAELRGFPPATCELAGGMATAYHRRPVLTGRDIAALAHVKIGNGSAWQGYYMYAGGTNPAPGMQESQATGYPNDMPALSYDFHAAIGQAGELGDAAPLLRAQHAFLTAFGPLLGEMTASLPDAQPSGLDDRATLRWALRSDGDAGFVVISHHQPYEPVFDVPDAQLRLSRDAGDAVLPATPTAIPAGTLARWPVGLRLGEASLDWATASALTRLGDLLVLVEDAGVPVEVSVGGRVRVVVPGDAPLALDGVTLLVLPAGDLTRVWVQELPGGGRRLLRTAAELAWDGAGRVWARGAAPVEAFAPLEGAWRRIDTGSDPERAEPVPLRVVRAAGDVPADYGFAGRRHSAPGAAEIDARAAVFALTVPAWALQAGADAVIDIDWAGDLAELRVDGRAVDDRFWDGTTWTVSLQDAGATEHAEITLHALPLPTGSTIALPEAAARRRAAASGTLLSVDAVRVRARGAWREITG